MKQYQTNKFDDKDLVGSDMGPDSILICRLTNIGNTCVEIIRIHYTLIW